MKASIRIRLTIWVNRKNIHSKYSMIRVKRLLSIWRAGKVRRTSNIHFAALSSHRTSISIGVVPGIWWGCGWPSTTSGSGRPAASTHCRPQRTPRHRSAERGDGGPRGRPPSPRRSWTRSETPGSPRGPRGGCAADCGRGVCGTRAPPAATTTAPRSHRTPSAISSWRGVGGCRQSLPEPSGRFGIGSADDLHPQAPELARDPHPASWLMSTASHSVDAARCDIQ